MPGITCDICGQNEMEPIDGDPNMYRCAYCGTKYTKEQLQERLVKIEGPIKVEGVQDFDKLLENGKTFLKLNELGKAYDVFVKLTNEYPSRYESWYGYVKTCVERNETTDGKIKVAKQVANDLEKMQILQDLKSITSKLESENNYKKAIRYHQVITEGYPEFYLSWYDYVKCNFKLDHVSHDEFKKAVELANEQEENLMISEFMSFGKELEEKENYAKSANAYEILLKGFPGKSVGYYGYIRETTKKFRELYEKDSTYYLDKALELAKIEENKVYIDDLETFKEITKNLKDIKEHESELQRIYNKKSLDMGRVQEEYNKAETSKKAAVENIKATSNNDIGPLKEKISQNKREISYITSTKFKVTFVDFIKVIIGLVLVAAISIGYFMATFASGSVGLGFLGLFLIAIPLAIDGAIWGAIGETSWEHIRVNLNKNSQIKKLQKANDSMQKKVDKLTNKMNQKVSSQNEANSQELKTMAETRDKKREDIDKETSTKVETQNAEINVLKAKNEELFAKISA